MSNSNSLKYLQVRRDELDAEISLILKNLNSIESELTGKRKQLEAIKKEIQEISQSRPVVSEHALLRYCERILKIDLKKIEQEMLSEKNVALIEHIRSGKIPVEGRFKMVVKNKVIVTIED